MTKTRAQVREELAGAGVTPSQWAVDHGFKSHNVYAILNDSDINPRRKCTYGESHRIAVALGLKAGQIVASSSSALKAHR